MAHLVSQSNQQQRKVLGACFSNAFGTRISTVSRGSHSNSNRCCRLFRKPPVLKFPVTLSSRAYRATNERRSDASSGGTDHDHDTTTRAPSWSDLIASRGGGGGGERPFWSEEWRRLGLGADLVDNDGGGFGFPGNLFFVQLGIGVDQHGDRNKDGFATKAAVRAVRNAIEFNSIPGVIDHLPGGRKGMLVHVKLGVPVHKHKHKHKPPAVGNNDGVNVNVNVHVAAAIDALEVAKVFPYGKLLPIEIVEGGLDFHSGRVVEELGDDDDVGVCCVACVSIGYNDNENDDQNDTTETVHKTYNTKDGY
mmetsp:Transcript_3614/g.6384  ORF Transcript_3614/g.6384 Transcript_3614/m.6384 type:complete len:307 (+) Transcript_3614:75-995(+)